MAPFGEGATMVLEANVSAAAIGKLAQFSAAAGRGHIHDGARERWRGFLIQVNLEKACAPKYLVYEWLQKEGWPYHQSVRLAADYEEARLLLSDYDALIDRQ